MKKLLFSIAFLCAMFSNGQTIETKSSCDSNTDGKVDITDVTNTAYKVLGKAAEEKQVVTAEDLNAVLQSINEKLEKLSALESRLNSLEAMNYSMAEKMGLPYNNGHEYVDLGLSVKWATMNVGATEVAGSKLNSHTGQLDCYGEYYAWGEICPKDVYNWSTYTLCNGSSSSITKYCTSSSYGSVDDKTTLELTDDAARANWGGSWRMPTNAEQNELKTKCTWTWTAMNGVNGYKVSASNGNFIFLPASGGRGGSSFVGVGSGGDYWSSTLDTDSSYLAYYLYFNSYGADLGNSGRFLGYAVRPVCP